MQDDKPDPEDGVEAVCAPMIRLEATLHSVAGKRSDADPHGESEPSEIGSIKTVRTELRDMPS